MAWTWIVLPLLTLAFVLYKKKTVDKKLPPGPTGFPIFGCLHLLGKSPHRNLQKLSQKYGPIMHLRLGLVPTIVASSPEAAELFLKTHDLNFASRPLHEASRHMSYDQKNLTFGAYGPYWRNMRKMCTLELLSQHKISSFQATRKQELDLFIESLKSASRGRVPVDLGAKVAMHNTDISCRMIFGRKYSDEEFSERGFRDVFQEAIELSGAPNLGNYIPLFASLDLQGFTKRMKAISKVFDGFLERIIDQHVQSKAENRTKDFVDVMLDFVESEESEYQIGRDNIKAVILDMLGAAMDTSATTVEWALSELIKHPQKMSKLQDELQARVGLDRTVQESDLPCLEYLTMVVKETFRLHPVVPLLLPHEAIEDCDVNGFHIPKKSQVLVNAWAIGRDPDAWTDPERFFPERFTGSDVDVLGRDFQLIPFGSGRRGCPGLQLGLTLVRLVLAQLVHCFDWELPNGIQPCELDMDEEFGIVVRRANRLVAIPRYRLSI